MTLNHSTLKMSPSRQTIYLTNFVNKIIIETLTGQQFDKLIKDHDLAQILALEKVEGSVVNQTFLINWCVNKTDSSLMAPKVKLLRDAIERVFFTCSS